MLKHLNIDEMVGLIAPWVTNAKRKELFLSIPEIAHLHPKFVALHDELLAVRPAATEPSPELKKLAEAETVVDARHDQLARATSSGIESDRAHCLAAEPPELDRARQCAEIQNKLFPNGMNIVNASLLAESGNTARVARLLHEEPEIEAFLKAIPVRGKHTLLDTAKRWITAGAALGKLEHQRAELEAKAAKPADNATVTALRSRWIKLVTLLLDNLDVSTAPAEAVEIIRGPVVKASERAGKRYAGGGDGTGIEPAAQEGSGAVGPNDPAAKPGG